MSAAGRNIFKTIVGLAIGAGIGALFAKEVGPITGQEPATSYGFANVEDQEPQEPKETLKERWQRALSAGESAQEAKEAELRSYFRHKVDDPTAFTVDRADRQS